MESADDAIIMRIIIKVKRRFVELAFGRILVTRAFGLISVAEGSSETLYYGEEYR